MRSTHFYYYISFCAVCWFHEFFYGNLQHSVEKREILSHQKKISSNQLFTNFFSETVTFTKSLPKCVRENSRNFHTVSSYQKFRQIKYWNLRGWIVFTKFFQVSPHFNMHASFRKVSLITCLDTKSSWSSRMNHRNAKLCPNWSISLHSAKDIWSLVESNPQQVQTFTKKFWVSKSFRK